MLEIGDVGGILLSFTSLVDFIILNKSNNGTNVPIKSIKMLKFLPQFPVLQLIVGLWWMQQINSICHTLLHHSTDAP